MNVNRRLPDGSRHPEEVANKSQIYITTAGYKGTFAYRKLMQVLVQSITDPGEAMIMGGTWRIPVLEGLLQRSFVDELKMDGTYNEASFEREYKQELYSLNIVNCWEALTREARVISSQAA